MTSLLVYILAVVLLALFALVVIFNFLRYRYKGDKTLVFIVLFGFLFVADIIFTLSILQPFNI